MNYVIKTLEHCSNPTVRRSVCCILFALESLMVRNVLFGGSIKWFLIAPKDECWMTVMIDMVYFYSELNHYLFTSFRRLQTRAAQKLEPWSHVFKVCDLETSFEFVVYDARIRCVDIPHFRSSSISAPPCCSGMKIWFCTYDRRNWQWTTNIHTYNLKYAMWSTVIVNGYIGNYNLRNFKIRYLLPFIEQTVDTLAGR